jgi:hypothetical protein
MSSFTAPEVSFPVRVWRHVGLLTVLMGVQIIGLAIAGLIFSTPFLIIGAFFLSFGLFINFIPMSSRAWGHLLSVDTSPEEMIGIIGDLFYSLPPTPVAPQGHRI